MSLTETLQEILRQMPGVNARRILYLSASKGRLSSTDHPENELYHKLEAYLDGGGFPPADFGPAGAKPFRLLAQRMVESNLWGVFALLRVEEEAVETQS